MIKPLAFVVPAAGCCGATRPWPTLKARVKQHLAPYKYPRVVRVAPRTAKTTAARWRGPFAQRSRRLEGRSMKILAKSTWRRVREFLTERTVAILPIGSTGPTDTCRSTRT
ncbi:MAG: hypothetical protein R3E96_09095 [Planctomycetota bacterium]